MGQWPSGYVSELLISESWRHPIQNHSSLYLWKKTLKGARISQLIFHKIFTFLMKTSMPNHVESLRYIKCWSSSSPIPTDSCNSDTTVKRSAVDWEDLNHTANQKKGHITLGDHQINKFFTDITNHRKKTNKAVFFSCTPFLEIFKYRDYWWEVSTICKTRFLQTHTVKVG